MRRRFITLLCLLAAMVLNASAEGTTLTHLNDSTFELTLPDGRVMHIDFYGPNIVRLFLDPEGGLVRDPEATPPAQILADSPRRDVGEVKTIEEETLIGLQSSAIALTLGRHNGRMEITDVRTGRFVTGFSVNDLTFNGRTTSLRLAARRGDHFYGGGVQNGRWAHQGKSIAIENTNSWVDGGVASPTPFFWSTSGYGVLWHTFRPGRYDFCATAPDIVELTHETAYLDIFVMVDDEPVDLLRDYYQLTGNPVLLPKFGFYEGHLNAYNRDYWLQVDGTTPWHKDGPMFGDTGIFFEDGMQYREDQKDNGGSRETLNGDMPLDYQFSARAVIDRYAEADMPLGWLLPNDGYGAGYGQASSLEANVANLRQLGEYAHSKGVEIGLWTQSDLHPKEGVEPLLQRDIESEVRDAGVRVLKTDVAWVGAGYSFGLNGVADVGRIMPEQGNDARPFIISIDGWAGTQRYAGIWTGDQTGGEWEYIRFHLPTYIGAGLSGQPNITSDVDGIFGGRNMPVNVRDFQWKTFTPMELNMDGWGYNPKYPQALGEPATSINRWYLKLKSMLMPYTYTIAHEATMGMPMIRPVVPLRSTEAAFATPGAISSYEFLYGDAFLVAPIYKDTHMDADGNDIRDNIYLPDGQWVDYFSGTCYDGGRVLNQYKAPLWKLPVFVRRGAIVPIIHAHNNPTQVDQGTRAFSLYPKGHSEFTVYDDDGHTQAYLRGESATTHITTDLNAKGRLTINVDPTQGSYQGMNRVRSTEFVVNLGARPKKIVLRVNGKKVRLDEAQTERDFTENTNVFYYDPSPELNLWATPGTTMSRLSVRHTPRLYICVADADITATSIAITIDGYTFNTDNPILHSRGTVSAPVIAATEPADAYSIEPQWQPVVGADFYEVEHKGLTYVTQANRLLLSDLEPETSYPVRVRAVNSTGVSAWAAAEFATTADPLRLALHGITGTTTCANQPGQDIANLFDFDLGTTWHTAWSETAVPFDLVADMHAIATLDRIQYVPRTDAGNGTITRGTLAISMDGLSWTDAADFDWAPDASVKEIEFTGQTRARYLRLRVTAARGGFGSGLQLYVFHKEGTEIVIPGDINHDNHVDEADLTSYMNYTGLRRGDGDFEGYISGGDLNQNGLIDAYDISNVAIKLEGGVSADDVPSVAGRLAVSSDIRFASKGDMVTLTVRGHDMRSVNAMSFALPYDATQWEYVGCKAIGMKDMRDLTCDRLHSNGRKALYPTFVNCGEHPTLEGNADLITITFRALRNGTVSFKAQDIFLVDKKLRTSPFTF